MYIARCFYNHAEAGPCKFVSKEKGKINVEFFLSPIHKEILKVKQKEIKRLKLFDQTRVYVKLEDGWRMGRKVMWYDDESGDGTYNYRIQFPNKQFEELSFTIANWN